MVASNSSDQYKEFMQQGVSQIFFLKKCNFSKLQIVGPFVSVHELDVFLNIANFTLTFFHIKDGRTFLLGRYMNDQISHYKWTEIVSFYFFMRKKYEMLLGWEVLSWDNNEGSRK